MRRSKRNAIQFGEKSLSIALFFILIVVLLIGLSIALKIYLLFKAAKFDGEHQFIFEIHAPSQNQLISFNPDTNSAVVLSIKDMHASSFGNYLGIPESAILTLPEKYDSLYTLTQNLLFHPSNGLSLNVIDRIRMFLFVNNIKPTNITEDEWTQSEQGSDKKLSQLFVDHTAYSENLSIAIVNGSGISGLGTKVAEELSHIGINIISVTSSQDLKEKTTIVYTGKEGYTVQRLVHIFRVASTPTISPMLSDVTITLGKDAAGEF